MPKLMTTTNNTRIATMTHDYDVEDYEYYEQDIEDYELYGSYDYDHKEYTNMII